MTATTTMATFPNVCRRRCRRLYNYETTANFPQTDHTGRKKRGKGRCDILTLKVTQMPWFRNLVITIEPTTFMQKSRVRFSTLVHLNTRLWISTTLSNQLWRQLRSSSSVLGLPFLPPSSRTRQFRVYNDMLL